MRGSSKSLGIQYSKEKIKERIEAKVLEEQKRHTTITPRKRTLLKDDSSRKLIDTSEKKFSESSGLKHWADIQNLKIAAATYSQAGSITELKQQISAQAELAKTARTSLVETEHQLKDLGQILKYAKQYQSNRIYHIRYKNSKDPDRYFRKHETELLLYDGAETMLKRFGINLKTLDVEKLQNDYNTLYAKKETLQKAYQSAEKESNNLSRRLETLTQYLQQEIDTEQTPFSTKNRNKSL